MTWTVEFSPSAAKQMEKLDRPIALMIMGWIKRNLVGCLDPRAHGKCLSGNLAGSWRYRVGDYRLLCHLDDRKIVILVLSVGHRKEIYR